MDIGGGLVPPKPNIVEIFLDANIGKSDPRSTDVPALSTVGAHAQRSAGSHNDTSGNNPHKGPYPDSGRG